MAKGSPNEDLFKLIFRRGIPLFIFLTGVVPFSATANNACSQLFSQLSQNFIIPGEYKTSPRSKESTLSRKSLMEILDGEELFGIEKIITYNSFNAQLRQGIEPQDKPWRRSYYQETLAGLRKIPNFKGVAYRGAVNLPKDQLELYRTEGATVADLGFASASRDPQIAANAFSDKRVEENPIFFVIKSNSGKSIETLFRSSLVGPGAKNELEIVFLPGTAFQVVSVKRTQQGLLVVHLTEL